MVARQQADTARVASNVYMNSHLERRQLRFVPSVVGARSTDSVLGLGAPRTLITELSR